MNDRDLSYVWRNLPRSLDLSYIDLSDLNLRGVKFNKTFLIYTDFRNSQLDDAEFYDTWVRNADFSNATISQVRFIKSDWFNAVGFQVGNRDGRPVPYSDWQDCPDGYRESGKMPFIKLFDEWYALKFADIEPSEAANMVDLWKEYAKTRGVCDMVRGN